MTSNEELIEYAKIHYRPGTVYISIHILKFNRAAKKQTIPINGDYDIVVLDKKYVCLKKDKELLKDSETFMVHVLAEKNKNNKFEWSQIISKPICYEI